MNRDGFEKWMGQDGGVDFFGKLSLDFSNDGEYADPEVYGAWIAWQAAWNTRADQGGEALFGWIVPTLKPSTKGALTTTIYGGEYNSEPGDLGRIPLYTHPPHATAVEVDDDMIKRFKLAYVSGPVKSLSPENERIRRSLEAALSINRE